MYHFMIYFVLCLKPTDENSIKQLVFESQETDEKLVKINKASESDFKKLSDLTINKSILQFPFLLAVLLTCRRRLNVT